MEENFEVIKEIMEFAMFGDRECIKKMVEFININMLRDESGNTLLHWAAKLGDVELAKIVYNGIPRNKFGRTPLHYATNREVAEFLISRGAYVDDVDEFGRTPLHYAAIENRADVVEVLIKSGANINARDNEGNTPLKLALLNGSVRVAKILIKAGATLDDATLHYAVWYGDRELVELILQRGVNPNIRDSDGRMPLHIAVWKGFTDIVEMLLRHGADPNARDGKGLTPVYYAGDRCKRGEPCAEIIELLIKHGADTSEILNAVLNEEQLRVLQLLGLLHL